MVPGAGIVLASPWDDGRPNYIHGSYRYYKNCRLAKLHLVVVVGPLALLRLALAVQVRRDVAVAVVIVDCILVPGHGPRRGVPVFAWHDRRLVRWRH